MFKRILAIAFTLLLLSAARAAWAADPLLNGGSLNGFVTALSAESITVNGVTVAIDPDLTTINGPIAVGSLVIVIYNDLGDGPIAFWITNQADENGRVNVSGQVSALSDTSLQIGAYTFQITPDTVVTGDLALGRIVSVVSVVGDFQLIAVSIQVQPEVNTVVIGFVTNVTPAAVTVGNTVFTIGPNTLMEGAFAEGAIAIAIGAGQPDGTVAALALIVLFEAGAQTPVFLLGEVEAISATSLTVGGAVFAITPDTQIRGQIAVGDFVSVTAEPDGAGGYNALFVERLWGLGNQGTYAGEVVSVATGSFVVDDQLFGLTPDTVLDAPLAVGDQVWVLYEVQPDESLVALEVVHLNARNMVFGAVERMSGNSITVNGATIALNARTVMPAGVKVGDLVEVGVSGAPRSNGPTALYVGPLSFAPSAVALSGAAALTTAPSAAPALALLALALLTATLAALRRRARG